MKRLSRASAEDLLEIFHRKYLCYFLIIATNRPVDDWSNLIGDITATSAILDHCPEKRNFIKMTGISCRFKIMQNLKKVFIKKT